MKKIYMSPETTRIEVELLQMIAESGSAAINREETVGNENDVESRRSHNLWDDDEEY